MKKKLYHAMFERLSVLGVTHIFGIVGRETEFLEFPDDRAFRFILVRNEQNAGIMAEAFARVTGRAQVCFSTMGPGVTNMATGVASAYKEGVPLLAISAQIETFNIHPGAHQYIDSVKLMTPLCKRAVEPRDAQEVLAEIERCWRLAHSGRPGPCFISIPIDLFSAEVEFDVNARVPSLDCIEDSPKTYTQISALTTQMAIAKQPLIVCGASVMYQGASDALTEFAGALGIPVATSLAGKGCFPEVSPLSVGVISKYLNDFFGIDPAAEIFSKADFLLLVGFDPGEDLGPKLWGGTRPRTLARLEVSGAMCEAQFDVDFVAEVSNLAVVLSDMQVNLLKKKAGGWKTCAIDVAGIRQRRLEGDALKHGKNGLNPFRVVRVIQQIMNDEDVLVVDVGLHKHICGLTWSASVPLAYLGSNGLATMGFGLPAAMGVKLANNSKFVVAVVGDGGFGAVLHEMETCSRERMPVVVIVFRNGSYGLIQRYHRAGYGQIEGHTTEFQSPNFQKLASAFGWESRECFSEAELMEALRRARMAVAPTLLVVNVAYVLADYW